MDNEILVSAGAITICIEQYEHDPGNTFHRWDIGSSGVGYQLHIRVDAGVDRLPSADQALVTRRISAYAADYGLYALDARRGERRLQHGNHFLRADAVAKKLEEREILITHIRQEFGGRKP